MKKQKLIFFIVVFLTFNFSFTIINCSAQLTILKDFNYLNGAQPLSSFIYDGTYLYGTTFHGGTYGLGTVFRIKPNGTGDSILFNCTPTTPRDLEGALYSDGSHFYGTSVGGGAYNNGTIYRIKFDGSGDTILYSFNNNSHPTWSCWAVAGLISDGTYLYGTASQGGINDNGFVFKIKPDGTGYAVLLLFNGTNGSRPVGSLFFDGTYLYGTTENGGANNWGTIFRIKPNGTAYTMLLDFHNTNSSSPRASFLFDGTYLYGTTVYYGLSSTSGTIYRIKPDGTGYTRLFDFNGTNGNGPSGDLISDGTYLYGTTLGGGLYGNSGSSGTIFKIKPDGTGFTTLFNFHDLNGSTVQCSLFYDGTYFYGTASTGGSTNYGTAYKLCITSVTSSQSFVICQGHSISVGTNTYTTTGTYVDHISCFNGCDSIVTTQLTVLPTNTFSQTITKCAGDSLTVGTHTYTVSGTYTDTFSQTVSGCDSIVITSLTIFNANVFQSLTLCAGHSLIVGTRLYSVNGIYKDTLTSKVCTCDSIITTNLTVLPVNTFHQSSVICAGGSLIIGTHTYANNGIYIDTLTSNVYGCDSIISTHLIVLPVNTFQQSYTICAEDSLIVGNHIYVESGIYTDTLISKVYNCDSTVTTNLSVSPAIFFTQSDSIYAGSSLIVGTNKYNSSGTYTDIFTSFKGCDSTVITNLKVKPNYLKISPNPSTGKFNFTHMEKESQIKIYDFTGRLILNTMSEDSEYTIDLSDKACGIYLYKVIGINTLYLGKLIKL